MSPVRRLDPILVDRIAAGEVVERPAAAVKELVENALDAGARAIEVEVGAGGRRLIRVVDDGCGMSPEDLGLAVERHATSKLPTGDLTRIDTLGFRGEALPSIGAVSRLAITSRTVEAETGSTIVVEAGVKGAVRPAPASPGTRIEVTDLFSATPARLKFLKGDRAEAQAVAEVVKRLAVAHPGVRFTLRGDHLTAISLPPEEEGELGLKRRLGRVLGAEFGENAVPLNAAREGFALSGFVGLPTFHRGSAGHIHFTVNGRPVRDKLLLGAVRGAYSDLMAGDRHPVLALAIACDPRIVDVNVHPAKSEVRFRDPALVRGLIVTAIKDALGRAGHRSATTGGARTLDALRPATGPVAGSWQAPLEEPEGEAAPVTFSRPPAAAPHRWSRSGFGEPGQAAYQAPSGPAPARGPYHPPSGPAQARAAPYGSPQGPARTASPEQFALGAVAQPSADARAGVARPVPEAVEAPLGAARAQLHGTYIVAQTQDGIVIVDQHAAHERLVYERLKREREGRGIARQILLIPEVVELEPGEVDRLVDHAGELAVLGLVVESFGPGAVAVREVPAALAGGPIKALVRDVSDAISEWGEAAPLRERLDAVLSRMSCHGSIRAGRQLRPQEMDALLREMEATPFSGQCNHGRPTYVELKLSDIEKLFGRR